jgi:hypothetical protein
MDWLEVSAIAGAIGVLVNSALFVIFFFQLNVMKRQYKEIEKEYGTYNALDEKFIEFQKLCLAYPYLDIFDVRDPDPEQLDKDKKKEELIAFTMLFSIFERAFIMYRNQDNEIKRQQWTGWDDYIKSFCKRKNFRDAWEKSGTTFDVKFTEYMNEILKKCATE